MSNNSFNRLKEQKGKPNFLVEVVNAEKQLWTLIHSKGLLCSEVKDLYRKACSSYEKIISNDHDLAELQDVEYSIWKLHYKHIDEFRKGIKRSSANSDNTTFAMPKSGGNVQRSNDNQIEGFKLFLLEAMEFYQSLMVKVKRCYGIPEESYFYEEGGTCNAVEQKQLQKCQFLCHRFLVCLGDLARYKEQYEKLGAQDQNWSVAATHYLEATKIWPDSGNPQNQLAVLAFYVGDELAALYHCIRSLAVKEPFPDAGNNLILLFERNGSTDLHSLCTEAFFDFMNPSERSNVKIKSQTSDDFSNCNMLKAEHNCFLETNLWSLIIRTMSFFFIKSSLKDFPCAFASTMRELDAMMALDDTKLKATLESYQFMDSARTGPFRALQIVAIFIFIIHDLLSRLGREWSEDKNDMQQLELIRFALTAAFIFMGRLVDRCLKSSPLDSCPLLPAVLVFVEWLAGMLDEAETHGADDKCVSAMSYFFGALVGLLMQLNARGGLSSPERTALWEDYELRGFAPLTYSQMSLDFSTHCGHVKDFESGKDCRAGRIIKAAIKIAKRTDGSRKWIIYDKTGAKFYIDSDTDPDTIKSEVELTRDLKVEETRQSISESTSKCDKQNQGENASSTSMHSKSVAMEEEEVIVFKPLTRYNSAPLYTSIDTKESESPKDIDEQTVPPDECLRRATSLLIAQNPTQGEPFAFHSDVTNFRPSKPFKQQEPLVKETGQHPLFQTPISAGPPSLSAWVFDRGSVNNDREKGRSDASKPGLYTIEEIVSASLSGLSMSGTEDSVISSGQRYASSHYTSPYSAPVPSAPLLPENATWVNDVQPSFYEFKNPEGINRTNVFSDPSHLINYPNWNATPGPLNYSSAIPGFMDGYTPFRGMTSSEWLRQYRENQNLERANSHSWPLHYYAPRNPGNFQGQDASRFDPFLQWQAPMTTNQMIYTESPLMHSGFQQVQGAADEHKRDKLFHVYQRPTPYGCSAVTDFREEPQPLLHYLKEKEWLLQKEPTLRGPTYMGN
ncbi:hypothetical protein ACOSP7_012009 [Xanthoceras sorbifolium]|uniref:Protein SMG7L n=1 Tax=Xanthoceras sorbifolium TaxID=99658 RepID=A0ABQ8HX26_9ROSI|nr:hypothetical protein JRO89_XS06G0070800 [Xanthoceras sorbifolium]